MEYQPLTGSDEDNDRASPSSRQPTAGRYNRHARPSKSRLARAKACPNLVAQPANRHWSWWGRVIFYVSDVDALYEHAVTCDLQPDTAPRDGEWGNGALAYRTRHCWSNLEQEK